MASTLKLTAPRLSPGFRSAAERWTTLGLAAVLAFFLVSGVIAYQNIQTLRDNNQRILHSHAVLVSLDELFSTVQDAETGQRGFLLTGNDRYLEPYETAVEAVTSRLDAVASLTHDNPVQQANLAPLKRHIDAKLAELKETIDLRKSQGAQAALAVVNSDRGKFEMDAVRAQVDIMRQEELRVRVSRIVEMDGAFRTALASGILSSLIGIVLTLAVFTLIRRNASAACAPWLLRRSIVSFSSASFASM
jgi:CHASE3 domain sensor protein